MVEVPEEERDERERPRAGWRPRPARSSPGSSGSQDGNRTFTVRPSVAAVRLGVVWLPNALRSSGSSSPPPSGYQPRALVARFQRTRSGPGRRSGSAAARARPLLLDLLVEPGRVLHGPGGRPAAAGGGRHRRPLGRRPHAAGGAVRHPERVIELSLRQSQLWMDDLRKALAPPRDLRSCPSPSWTRTSCAELSATFDREVFPVLTPLGVGPGQPFPYISGPIAQPGRARPQPGRRRGAVRPGQGAGGAAAVHACRARAGGWSRWRI